MRRCLALFLLFTIVSLSALSFYGFASSSVYPIYSGTLTYMNDANTPPLYVLSGQCDFWLNDYSPITMTEASMLLNAGTAQLIGQVKINGIVYDIRVPAGYDYIQLNQQRSGTNQSFTYFNYTLRIERIPSKMSDESSSLWLIASVVCLVVPCAIIGRFLL